MPVLMNTFWSDLGVVGGNTSATNQYDLWKGITFNDGFVCASQYDFFTHLGTNRYEFFKSYNSVDSNIVDETTFYQNTSDSNIYDYKTFYEYAAQYLIPSITPTPTPSITPTNTPTPSITASPTPSITPSTSPLPIDCVWNLNDELWENNTNDWNECQNVITPTPTNTPTNSSTPTPTPTTPVYSQFFSSDNTPEFACAQPETLDLYSNQPFFTVGQFLWFDNTFTIPVDLALYLATGGNVYYYDPDNTHIWWLGGEWAATSSSRYSNENSSGSYTATPSPSLYTMSRIGTSIRMYKGATLDTSNTQSSDNGGSLGYKLYLGAISDANVAKFFSKKSQCFAFMSAGLTNTESIILNTAINTFQTTLGRNSY